MLTDKAMLMTGVDGIIYVCGALTSLYTIDRLGRRKLMYAGLIGHGVTLALVGGFQYAATEADFDNAAPAIVVFVASYNFVFGATWLSLAWLYPSEIFPTTLRAKGNSLSTAANWIGNFVVAEVGPILFEYASYWTFVIFSILNVLYLIPVYFYFPETKGKSLEEIEKLFATEEILQDTSSEAIASSTNPVGEYAQEKNAIRIRE